MEQVFDCFPMRSRKTLETLCFIAADISTGSILITITIIDNDYYQTNMMPFYEKC